MNQKTKVALQWIAPIVLGVGVIGYFSIRNKKKMASAEVIPPGVDAPGASLQTVMPVASSVFPLRQGSNNDKVRDLQALLGTTVDGAFGPNTEAALLAFGGVRTVDSQAQLDQLKKQAAGVTNIQRAQDMVSKFKKGGQAIYIIAKTQWPQVIEDSYGAVIRTGKAVDLLAGKIYNNTDYKLYTATKGGNVLVNITRGTLLGLYEVDPNTITLQAT